MDKKKLKIAFLSRYVGKVDRGVETYVSELSKLLKLNHQVDVLSGKDSDSLLKILNGKYDIVVPTNGRLQALKVSLGRLLGHYKVIISGQAGVGKDDIWNLLVCRPNVYVALTEFEKEWARNLARGIKIVKIPNGVDTSKFKKGGGGTDISLPKPMVLSVGALMWYKHHERTIKAVSLLSDVSLLIVGSGPEEERLQSLGLRLLGEKRFKIVKASFEEIPSYYHEAQVFALPSWIRESFGIVYVEAMASNLPVVAPDDPPRREIIGRAGVLTDVEDRSKYAQAIKQALDGDWKDIPRKQAEKFSWKKVANLYEKLLEEI